MPNCEIRCKQCLSESIKWFTQSQFFKFIESYGGQPKCDHCGSRNTRIFNNKRVVNRDSFEPGWNPGLGVYVKSRAHQRELCKIMDLEEIGNDDVEFQKEKDTSDGIFDFDSLKEANQRGAQFSDNEGDHLIDEDKKGILGKEVDEGIEKGEIDLDDVFEFEDKPAI